MANLIDSTYFIRSINIPDTETPDENSVLTEAIATYEPEYLERVLGYTLWQEFITEIEGGSPAQKWLDLRDGAEFSFDYNGYTINTKWKGFVNDEKKSPIAYYVYRKYQKEVETINTNIGRKSQKGENSISASAVKYMVDAWSNCVNLSGKQDVRAKKYVDRYLDNNNYDYGNSDGSLFNFLLTNIADYPNWVFKPLWKENFGGY